MKLNLRTTYYLIDVATLTKLNEIDVRPTMAASWNRLLAPLRPKRRWVTIKEYNSRQAKRAVHGT